MGKGVTHTTGGEPDEVKIMALHVDLDNVRALPCQYPHSNVLVLQLYEGEVLIHYRPDSGTPVALTSIHRWTCQSCVDDLALLATTRCSNPMQCSENMSRLARSWSVESKRSRKRLPFDVTNVEQVFVPPCLSGMLHALRGRSTITRGVGSLLHREPTA